MAAAAREVAAARARAGEMEWKPHLTARLANLPICPELTRTRVPRSADVGRFLSFSGTVIRVTTVKMLEFEPTKSEGPIYIYIYIYIYIGNRQGL